MEIFEKKQNRGSEVLLEVISFVAKKNASSLCKGIMYEPKVPKKLKR